MKSKLRHYWRCPLCGIGLEWDDGQEENLLVVKDHMDTVHKNEPIENTIFQILYLLGEKLMYWSDAE